MMLTAEQDRLAQKRLQCWTCAGQLELSTSTRTEEPDMATQHTAHAQFDGVNYNGGDPADRAKLRALGFTVNDDGTRIESPANHGGHTINVNNGTAKKLIQSPRIEGGINW